MADRHPEAPVFDIMLNRVTRTLARLTDIQDRLEALMRTEAQVQIVADITSMYKTNAGVIAFYRFKQAEIERILKEYE